MIIYTVRINFRDKLGPIYLFNEEILARKFIENIRLDEDSLLPTLTPIKVFENEEQVANFLKEWQSIK